MELKTKAGGVFLNKNRFRVLVAGRRFGKTRLLDAIEKAEIGANPGGETWYIGPTYRQAKEIMWDVLKSSIPKEWIAGKPNETELSMTLVNKHVLKLKGANNPDSLRGKGLTCALFDEFDFIEPDVWPKIIRPMLATTGGKACFFGTPDGMGPIFDLYKRGQSLAPDDSEWASWQFTTLDGGWVPADEIEQAKRDMDERTFRQEFLASFERMAGLIYYAFSDANIRPIEPPQGALSIGIDFNVTPHMSGIVFYERSGEINVIDEILIPDGNTDQLITEAKNRHGVRITDAYPDPAGRHRSTSAVVGTTDHTILQAAGWRVHAHPRTLSVKDRINSMNAMLCNAQGVRRMFVDPKCKHLIAGLRRHGYKPGTSIPEEDQWVHALDAINYAVDFLFPIKKQNQDWTQ